MADNQGKKGPSPGLPGKSKESARGRGSRLGISSSAAKRRKQEQDKSYRLSRRKHTVAIGDVVHQDWQEFKKQSGLRTNDAALAHLLARHSSGTDSAKVCNMCTAARTTTSTTCSTRSESSEPASCSLSTATGSVQDADLQHAHHVFPSPIQGPSTSLESSSRHPVWTSTPDPSKSSGRRLFESPGESPIFEAHKSVMPLDFSSDSDEDVETNMPELPAVPHEHPSLHEEFSLQDLDESTVEESVLDYDVDDNVSDDGDDTDIEDESSQFDFDEAKNLIDEQKFIAYKTPVVSLLRNLHGTQCTRKKCSQPLSYASKTIGTALLVSWTCSDGHKCGRWTSQPRYKGMLAGNLQLATALLMSGNSFLKVALMFRFAGVACVSRDTFYRVQRLYAAPAISEYWQEMEEESLGQFGEGKPVKLVGDGRNDSPGFSSQYCTYTLCDMDTKKVLHMEVVDSREVDGKSVNMEKLGFERGMKAVMDKVPVSEITTDAHMSISAKIKNCKKYSHITHNWDMWHGGKNLYKKAVALAGQKGMNAILPWADAIRSHLWYASKKCQGNIDVLKAIWISYLHHVVNEHTWVVSDGLTSGECGHGELDEKERSRPWLKKDSPEHKALRQLILNERFMKTLRYYANFRQTGFLESFHNHLLMYVPKRHAYGFVGYKARNQLAAIDCNRHLNRPQQVGKDGKPKFVKKYSKRSKKWTAQPKLVPKKYDYIPELIERVFLKRLLTFGHLSQHVSLSEDNPKRISRTIAAVPPPSLAKLIQEREDRLQKE